jgi:MoxR-like ATPase
MRLYLSKEVFMDTVQVDQAVHQRMSELLHHLSKGLYEREEAIRLSLLSAIAGESIFLLGPPGVGKSLIARRLKYAFRDGTSFEYLMSKFSTPDEIFGPVSIKKLKEEDKYERKTDKYLPGANIVFLDEIWKAGPSIQNALLTILNEKIYRNGDQDLRVNIRGIITASNELPPKTENLAPIWDRFLIRLELGGIRQFRNFVDMIVSKEEVYEDPVPQSLKFTADELDEWDAAINEVEVPEEVLNVIQLVKLKIEEHNAKSNQAGNQIPVFDRRWKKIVRLLRTSAFLNGRQTVDLMDAFLMVHCLWSRPEQLELLQEIVAGVIRKHGYALSVNLKMVRKELEAFEQEVEAEIQVKHRISEEHPLLVRDEYYQLEQEADQFEGVLIPAKQFRTLTLQEHTVVNFFDEDLNLRNRLKAKRSPKEHTIIVSHNSIDYTLPLKTKKVERVEVIYKKPHPLVEKHWEERYEQLHKFMRQQQERLDRDAPKELKGLDENLFVDAAQSEVVRSNQQEVLDALEQFQLQLDKLRFSYQSVEGE